MSGYQRINFKDQNVERPKTYDVTNNPDGSITLIESFGNVEELGTPINQENMNHIEDGIDAVSFSKFNIDAVYKKDDLITDIQDNQLKIFKSLEDNNFGHLPTEKDFWEEVEISGGTGQPIGLIYPLVCSPDYIPNGSLPTDGAEYTEAQFNNLWNDYLTGEKPKLNTCTYAEYESDLATYGQCAKFAVDVENKAFRVPLIKDGAVIQQALTNDELGKSYNAGAPNITGSFVAGDTQTYTGAFYKMSSSSGGTQSGGSNDFMHGFDASLSNPIYGNSDTVQMNAVAMRCFVVVANGQTNQSMMDWSAWASSLQGKANADLSNISNIGKNIITENTLPNYNNVITVFSTAGAEGTFTAPCNGFMIFDICSYGVTGYITVNGVDIMRRVSDGNYMTDYSFVLPVNKNDVVAFKNGYTTVGYCSQTVKFAPMKGAN